MRKKTVLPEEIPAIPIGTKVITLENGLQIIIREDHSAPVVSAQAWCKTGSIHEGNWLGAGLSHVLEHMLFKGTTTRGSGRIDQEVQSAGGYMNAYTSFDRTVYFIDVPNTGATVAIDILCDIMRNATLPADELDKELDVIRREMDMCHDDPTQRSARRLFETAYVRSPYRFTVIGYPDIFNQIKREDIYNYYRDKYAANNIFFVVVGDIKAEEVEQQIRTAYAKVAARPLPPTVLPEEPRQLAERAVVEEAPVELAHLHLSWHIPDIRHPDIPVLDVLATILGSGRSSRLYQTVREKKGLVNSIDAWTYSPGNPGLFGLSAVVDAEKYEAARTAMLEEIERVKQSKVSQAELSKAIKMFIAGTLATRKTMAGQAQDLGSSWIAAGDLNFSARYLAAVKKITPQDIQRVSKTFLTTENRTLYALLPLGVKKKTVDAVEAITRHPIQKITLPNGIRLLLKPDHRLPFIDFRVVMRGGVLAETPANNGVTLLASKLLLKGTKNRTAEQISGEIESLGGSIDTYSGNNSFGVNLEVMNGDFTAGLNLLADVLLNPTFPAEALERERQVHLAAIRNQRDQLLQSAVKQMRKKMYGNGGYGFDALGTEESLSELKTRDLRHAYSMLAAPQNCVLAIFGHVDSKTVQAAVQKVLGKWKNRYAEPEMPSSRYLRGVQRILEKRDKKQAVIVIGFSGTTIFSEDHYALELIQEACSDLGSRLFTRIREKLGLAYYVGAQNFLGLMPGYFAFYAGTDPEKAALCEAEMIKEAEVLRDGGLSQEELKRAKAKVVGQKKISRQDLGNYASVSALDELYGLGYGSSDADDEKYEAVTIEQVRAVARKYLTLENMVISVVMPG